MEPTAKNLNRVKIVVYSKDQSKPPVMAALVQQLSAQRARIDSEVLNAPAAIVKSVAETNLTVLIISLHDKEELLEVLNVLTQLEGRIQSGLLRALVINGMNHPRVVALLKAKGVTEIVDFNANIKALNHKIKNALLLVTQAFQRLQNQKIQPSAVVGSDSRANAQARNARENATEVTWLKPSEHLSDFWWIPSARNFRFVMGRWLLDLLGPGPSVGTWEPTTYERQGEKGWEWKIRVSTDPTFQPRSGRWLFFGKQPEFVWQKNFWSFVSKFPYLAFYAEGESDAEYVRVECPTLGKASIYENSEASREYLPKIQASLEASMKLSKSEGTEEADGSFSNSGGLAPVTRNPNFSQGDLSEDEPLPDWNHHESSIGVNFKSKDLRIDESKPKTKWRNALSPDSANGGKMGMIEVDQKGVASGAKSFEQFNIRVSVRLRNAEKVPDQGPLHVIEMTKEHATFEYPRSMIVEKDIFNLRVEFRLGNVEREFEVEWSCRSIQAVDRSAYLAYGEFTGGALAELASIVTLIEQRQVELRDFFIVAKGA